MAIEVPMSLVATQQWFTKNALNEQRNDFSFFLQHIDDSNTRLVAMGGLVDIDRKHQRAELYIVVDPEMTRRGIGKIGQVAL